VKWFAAQIQKKRSYRTIAAQDIFEPLGMVDTAIGLRADLKDRKLVPYTRAAAIIFPSSLGAHNWQPMSFSPKSGLVYIPTTE
jgi:CubicO group peptidase (beta-lactamase class C family)